MIDEVERLCERVARLEAERAVQSTFNEYLYHLDFGRHDAMIDVFTEDATWTLVNFPPGSMERVELKGRAEIHSFYANSPGYPPLSGGHLASNVAIGIAPDCSNAELSAYFTNAYTDRPGVWGGMYQATLRPSGAKWRIADYRILVSWGWRPDKSEPLTNPVPPGAFKREGRPPADEVAELG